MTFVEVLKATIVLGPFKKISKM